MDRFSLLSYVPLVMIFLWMGATTGFAPPSPLVRRRASELSKCYIFFRTNESLKGLRVPDELLKDMNTTESFPFRRKLEKAGLCVRRMERGDLERISDLCYKEYSTGESTLSNFPFAKPLEISDWLDQLLLRPLVDSTMFVKVDADPADHAVLVATLDDVIVGMIEVSQQPVNPENNPSPVPTPLVVKQALHGGGLQGWITNLLVAPEYRGRGLSKLLVVAAERQTRWWKRTSIHLHCDASVVSGRVAQKLYESMGYQTIQSEDFAWSENNIACSVYVIEGVPLLYLQKSLVD